MCFQKMAKNKHRHIRNEEDNMTPKKQCKTSISEFFLKRVIKSVKMNFRNGYTFTQKHTEINQKENQYMIR